MKITYGLDDIALVQSTVSLDSRTQANPVLPLTKQYPIFIAPMTGLIDNERIADKFIEKNFIPIINRSGSENTFLKRWELSKKYWVAFGVTELEGNLSILPCDNEERHICIDTPNGTMPRLYKLGSTLRREFPYSLLMAGNIDNPDAIKNYMNSGFDYIRLGIGGGSQCATSIITGTHYGMASLIEETYNTRLEYAKWCNQRSCGYSFTKIIADGGINEYGKICKALSLGADYVMIGGMAARISDCGGLIYYDQNKKIPYRTFHGMSTYEGQEELGKTRDKCHSEEGIHSIVEIDKTLEKFTNEVHDALTSAMAYYGITRLDQFISVNKILISNSAFINYRGDKKI